MSPPRIILTLKLKGLFCPCLESQQDREARESVTWLQSKSSWKVQWHRPLIGGQASTAKESSEKTGNKAKSVFTSFVSSFVQTVVSSTIGYNTVDARFGLVENEHGIALRIVKLSTLKAEQDEEERSTGLEDEDSEVEKGPKNKRKERVILLRKISVVEPSSNVNGIVVFAVNESSITGSTSTAKSNAIVNKGKELIRFDLMSPSKTDDEMANLRDEFIDRISSLIEWEHKRFRKQSSQDDDNDETTRTHETDEDGEPIHRNIAQRAAHFAKREIEMAHTKMERESRKAKYMSASGGLKYTALAMATRAEIS